MVGEKAKQLVEWQSWGKICSCLSVPNALHPISMQKLFCTISCRGDTIFVGVLSLNNIILCLSLHKTIHDIMYMEKKRCYNRLRVILADKEITNRWLAEQMGVTDMTVSRWKTNKIQPSMMQFVEIARLLKVDIKDLIEADFNYEIE